MTPPPLPPPPSVAAIATPALTLDHILHHLLPVLLVAALSVKSFVGRWRLLHSKLSLLQSSLADAARSPHWPGNPLFVDLLPPLLSTLRSLHSLSTRCLDPSLPAGKLLLQSDLDIAASTLSLYLHDLDLLLRSGLLHHLPSAGAIVLPLPGPSATRADLALFARDLFARLQIGSIDLKSKALDSLLQLLAFDPPKIAPLVAAEGDLPYLVRLLDPSAHSLIRDQAAAAVSLLATACDASRRAVFEDGALGPLLRVLDSGSLSVRERAAAAIEAITADPANAWAVSAYGGVPILIAACRSGSRSPAVQALAAGSLKNISSIDDLRTAMAEEGAVPVLIDLLLSGTLDAQKNAALCLWSLASAGGEEIRDSIVREGGLQRLLQLLREVSDSEAAEHALRAIHALSASPAAARALSSSRGFFAHLTDLIPRGSTATQQTAAAVVCNLSPSDDIKRSMAGCMAALVKMLESPKPTSAQEVAARALVSLLTVRSNRKELSRDEKSVTRLVQMLDPRNDEVGKKFPVSVVLTLAAGVGGGCRRRISEAGACQHLQKLADAEVPGAKKALQKIAGSRLKSLFSTAWRESTVLRPQ
ncbi:protein CELLULOSE SYNTHASE INTERACTIVE 1-like [Phoenix dactylifera]|uniref:Protein CELLULOSE SYNTHASE INTERACTIVE 1-like n=1 Tax=Phoenix dactylifera TaxID=42345 RepID=A0A8B7CHJ7_PHODC|nr:protein CELLULOSE SYNTHASE INTERACTIVE 1-like [Phoenix dactylifera]XP_026663202.2 protein CELLULOSE SYNTHASE INTERACTIVE 1-like [Phoenix dactylifera]